MILNFILRFFWLIQITSYSYESANGINFLKSWEIVTCSSIIAEALRRTIWVLIRVENEFFNNFEQYRSTSTIPDLIDEIDVIDK